MRHLYNITMDYRFLYLRIKNLTIDPVREWDSIMAGDRSLGDIKRLFLLPLVIMASVAAFLGTLFFTHSGLNIFYSVFAGVRTVILYYTVVYAFTYLYNLVSGYLELKKDRDFAFRLIVYSISPLLVCQIISQLFESLIFVNVLSFYGLYFCWAGLLSYPGLNDKKRLQLFIASLILFVVLFFGVDQILATVSDKVYFSLFS